MICVSCGKTFDQGADTRKFGIVLTNKCMPCDLVDFARSYTRNDTMEYLFGDEEIIELTEEVAPIDTN